LNFELEGNHAKSLRNQVSRVRGPGVDPGGDHFG
jgi:hypothetical protein